MIKRILGIFISASLLLSLNSYAIDYKQQVFDDISTQTPYYSEICELYHKNIINGITSNKFLPNNSITYGQTYIMALKAFRPDIKLPQPINIESIKNIILNNGWQTELDFQSTLWQDYPTPNQFYEIIFKVMGLAVYNCYYYNMISRQVAPFIMAKNLHLYISDNNFITRSEACHIINTILLKQYYSDEITPIEINIENNYFKQDQTLELYPYIYELNKVPDYILDNFTKDGFKFYIGDEKIIQFFGANHVDYTGLFRYGNINLIQIKDAQSIVHEFGHYVEYYNRHKSNFENKVRQLYKDEKEQFSKIVGSYCMTDSHEFFAEFFDAWFDAKTIPYLKNLLSTYTPNTFDFFQTLENINWGMS